MYALSQSGRFSTSSGSASCPSARCRLPSAALGKHGGGSLRGTDPGAFGQAFSCGSLSRARDRLPAMTGLGPVAWPTAPIRTERLVLRESEARDRVPFIELFASAEVRTTSVVLDRVMSSNARCPRCPGGALACS
jgi:hypothetical protein